MKTKFLLKACLLFILLTGCGKDGGIAGLFIPNFSNAWTSSRNTRFEFIPNATDVSKGTFFGSEESDFNEFTGTFNNYDIEFTITKGNEVGEHYSGKFIKDSNPLSMKVKGDRNKTELTITKQQ